jgi:hypothetical protein
MILQRVTRSDLSPQSRNITRAVTRVANNFYGGDGLSDISKRSLAGESCRENPRAHIFFVHISIYRRFGLDRKMVKYYGNGLYNTNGKTQKPRPWQ